MTASRIDTSLDSLGIGKSLAAFPEQCHQVIHEIALQHIPHQCYLVDNIVISGMGGSALGGRIVASLERQNLRIPVVVSTEYHLPNFVNRKSLVVISSYSGNTEETLASLGEARAREAQIYIITGGGKLAQIAEQFDLPAYIFNPVNNISGQPRMGLGYNVLALITLLSRCQLIQPFHDLNELPDFLTKKQQRTDSLISFAEKLVGRIPVLISSEHLKGAVHSFKNQLNENAKTFADLFDLPEANHHLLEGLSRPRSNSDNLIFIFFKSRHYHPEVLRHYSLTLDIVKKQHIPCLEYETDGPSRLFEVMELLQATSYIAYYLSLLNGVDPGPIPWVDYFKDQLKK
jgi:glucose/mannose-6-phosphate isomerase